MDVSCNNAYAASSLSNAAGYATSSSDRNTFNATSGGVMTNSNATSIGISRNGKSCFSSDDLSIKPTSQVYPKEANMYRSENYLPVSLKRKLGSNLDSKTSLGRSVSFRDLIPVRDNHDMPSSPLKDDVSDPNLMCTKTRLSYWKNTIVIAVSFCLIFTAFNSLQNLASSLLTDDGLGFYSLSLVYCFGIFSSIFTPFLVKKVTPKLCLVLSYITKILFTLAVLYPKFYTLLPASIILGSLQGPLWTAGILYVTNGALDYALATRQNPDPVISHFTGIFLCFQQCSQVIGNVLSSFVLQSGTLFLPPRSNNVTICGAARCPTSSTLSHEAAESFYNSSTKIAFSFVNATDVVNVVDDAGTKIYILGGIFLLLIVVAIILTVFLLDTFKISKAAVDYHGSCVSLTSVVSRNLSSYDLLVSSLRLLLKPEMILLFPVSFASGVQMATMFADFTQSYVTCELNMNWVGYTMTAYGLCDMIFCVVFGKLMKWIRRPYVFTMTYIIQMSSYLIMLFWKPHVNHLALFFVLPAMAGMCDAVWQPQIAAFVGILFRDDQEAGISNYRMFFILGCASTFAYGNFLCMSVKLYLAIAFATLGIISYYLLEYLSYGKKRHDSNTTTTL